MYARRALTRAAGVARTVANTGRIVPVFASRAASTVATNGFPSSPAPKAIGAGLGFAAAAGLVAYGSAAPTADAPAVDYEKVKKEIATIVEEGHGPFLVRLAWHAAGTYDINTKTGGSNGATMRFCPEINHGANAGLASAQILLEPVKAANPGLTYADLWTLAGCVAIEEMGGPAIEWRAGRSDAESGKACPPEGRLPNADMCQMGKTVQHVRDIFYRMGFNDREIVALLGAHALGRCHTDRSGYTGPWTRAETTFSNEYFRELLENTWTLKKWNGPEQFEDPTGELMMLPSDMALLWDKSFRQVAELYAKDQDVFFADFSKAFQKLMELGVPLPSNKPWYQFW